MERITLSQEHSSWYNKTVVVSRAPRRRIFIYTPQSFKELADKIRENMERNDTMYPKFHDFMKAGTYELSIGSNGELTLPEKLFKYIGQTGVMTVQVNQFGLEVGRVRPEECSCNDYSCRKCLLGNCKDDECTIHTKERKRRAKQSRR